MMSREIFSKLFLVTAAGAFGVIIWAAWDAHNRVHLAMIAALAVLLVSRVGRLFVKGAPK